MACGAGVALGGHSAPVRGLGLFRQAVTVAVPFASGKARGQGVVKLHAPLQRVLPHHAFDGFGCLGQRCRGALLVALKHVKCLAVAAHQALQLEFAHITATAFGQGKNKRGVEHGCQRGQVFGHQLLLQRHRGSRHHHPGLARQGHGHGGRQIGRRFANTSAGLNHGHRAVRLGLLTQGHVL